MTDDPKVCKHCKKPFQESLILAMLGELGARGSAIRGSVECYHSPTEKHEYVKRSELE